MLGYHANQKRIACSLLDSISPFTQRRHDRGIKAAVKKKNYKRKIIKKEHSKVRKRIFWMILYLVGFFFRNNKLEKVILKGFVFLPLRVKCGFEQVEEEV